MKSKIRIKWKKCEICRKGVIGKKPCNDGKRKRFKNRIAVDKKIKVITTEELNNFTAEIIIVKESYALVHSFDRMERLQPRDLKDIEACKDGQWWKN